jgi:hypothetical protein
MSQKSLTYTRKKLKENGGRLMALLPSSTRPKTVRRSEVAQEIIEFIKALREQYPRLGKEKIKPLLDEHCLQQGIKSVSESTIGNIIKRQKFFFQKLGRIYHDPNSKWAQKKVKRQKRLRVKHPPKPSEFGVILSDTVKRITDGMTDYFYSAIDAKLKFALTLPYKRLTSRNMKDFYQRFKRVYPWTIKSWQSDNGSENLGEFDDLLKKEKIPHFFFISSLPKDQYLYRTVQ